MRAPSPSFKSMIAAYRQRLVKERADYPLLPRALQVLDRWHDHAAVETIWNTIKERLPAEDMPTATQFIDLVLQHWDIGINLEQATRQTPEQAGAKLRAQAERHWRSGNIDRAAFERKLLASWIDDIGKQSDRLLGRKKAGAARRYFMAGWSDKFRKLTGQPLDPVVKTLTEIAFDDDVSIEAVRAAHMPARDRVIRPPK